MEYVPTYDEAHPVRWEPAGDPEAGAYITLHEALSRLVNHHGEDMRDWLMDELRAGHTVRTAWAFYRMGALQ